ncbi:hypothetical protein Nepgr_022004 [Nepenthes gracilis]|uniref:Uncharacterized protein n=1 Tax=Nepenthes gracilis TaxID=150966 RepID=A0AAD3SXT3_NEPGR|nr:hypothetical protein Nepgr_022004 [Nepenthes gracilis]
MFSSSKGTGRIRSQFCLHHFSRPSQSPASPYPPAGPCIFGCPCLVILGSFDRCESIGVREIYADLAFPKSSPLPYSRNHCRFVYSKSSLLCVRSPISAFCSSKSSPPLQFLPWGGK